MGNIALVNSHHSDGMTVSNEDIFENDLTVTSNINTLVVGPVTIPNVTVNTNGVLQVIEELNVTNNLTISGTLNIKIHGL